MSGEWVAILGVEDPDEQVDEAWLAATIGEALSKALPSRLRTTLEVRSVERA